MWWLIIFSIYIVICLINSRHEYAKGEHPDYKDIFKVSSKQNAHHCSKCCPNKDDDIDWYYGSM